MVCGPTYLTKSDHVPWEQVIMLPGQYPGVSITRLLSTQQCSYGCEVGVIYDVYQEFNANLHANMTVRHITDYNAVYCLLAYWPR